MAATGWCLRPIPDSLTMLTRDVTKTQLLDRNGVPLNETYVNRWNSHQQRPLSEIPPFIRKVFVLSEDKRFYDHQGVDWRARTAALWQNIRAFRAVRGASTISEQVVRLIHPRPRTIWSRWVEGFEAYAMEAKLSKEEILEFYLNQIPFASNRRGITQAARFYFDRSLETLSRKEILALAILIRSPSRFDLKQNQHRVASRIRDLAERLGKGQPQLDTNALLSEPLELAQDPRLHVSAPHFSRYAQTHLRQPSIHTTTTLDAGIQSLTQELLDRQIKRLRAKNVNNGSALVVNYRTGEILAWVVGGNQKPNTPAGFIDAVLSKRQPGSTLKPFVYAMALEKGWTAATLLDDSPYTVAVGSGLHNVRNYSRRYYGLIPLREALGNSLNVPAIKAAEYVGTPALLKKLHELGVESLDQTPDHYGEGLALGNGELSLFELVQAYTALANRGQPQRLHFLNNESPPPTPAAFSPESASLIANILSDTKARRREFSRNFAMNTPFQSALKTGTSTDFRDAWAIGFNSDYLVGVWMGNLNQSPMDKISGARGPAPVLHAVLSKLAHKKVPSRLYLSPRLRAQSICITDRAVTSPTPACHQREWFLKPPVLQNLKPTKAKLAIQQPRPNVILALDPRVPLPSQAFKFKLAGFQDGDLVEWRVNDTSIGTTETPETLWNLKPGKHRLSAVVYRNEQTFRPAEIPFHVKP